MTTLVVLHVASGILDLVYMGVTEVNGTMVANTVLRFTVVGGTSSWRGGYRRVTRRRAPVGSAPLLYRVLASIRRLSAGLLRR